MNFFKEDKIRHCIYKNDIKRELNQQHRMMKEKFVDTMASFQMRVEDKLRKAAPGRIPTLEASQAAIVDVFKEMIKEARDRNDWDAYGVLHILIGHNGIDPNHF